MRKKIISAFLGLALLAPLAFSEWVPGLKGGYIDAAFNLTDWPTENAPYLGPHAATNTTPPSPVWANGRTWVYTGQIYLDGTPFYFGEEMWDYTQVKLDGEVVLLDENWLAFKSSEQLVCGKGWHDIEIRFGHSSGRGGAWVKSADGFFCAFGIARGEKKPSSMAECFYTEDTGKMDLFRHDDGNGFANSFTVSLSPPGVVGTTSPSIGTHRDLAQGETIVCSAPPTLVTDRLHYQCRGYILAETDETGMVKAAVTNTGVQSLEYTHAGGAASLTWLYEGDGVLLDVTAVGAVASTIAYSMPPDLSHGCYSYGSEVTVTVKPAPGEIFSVWGGEEFPLGERAPSVTVRMDRPVSFVGIFSRQWLFNRETSTITDGNWILSVREKEGALSVNGIRSAVNPAWLDLSLTVEDPGGVVYPVTSIGGFSNHGDLSGVLLPSTLKEIQPEAFMSCAKLSFVLPFLPGSVESIGDSAFKECLTLGGDLVCGGELVKRIGFATFYATSLASAELPYVETVARCAFKKCASMTNAILPRVHVIEGEGFSYCENLERVTPFLSDSLASIGGAAFDECHHLTGDLVIENEGVTNLGKWCFNKTLITSARLSHVRVIGPSSFYNSSMLTNLWLPEVTRIESSAFANAKLLEQVVPFFCDRLEYIGQSAFDECHRLRGDLVLSNERLEMVPTYAFYKSRIRSVSMDHVKELGMRPFSNCPKLETVHMPEIEKIGQAAFFGSAFLTNVTPFLAPTLTSLGSSVFDDCIRLEGVLRIENPALTNLHTSAFEDTMISEVHFPGERVHLSENWIFFHTAPKTAFYFPGKAPGTPIGDHVFSRRNHSSRSTIYGSLRMDPEGWAALAEPLTEEDKAAEDYPGPKTFGILTSSGLRNWLVDWRSPCEPNGMVLYLR